MASLLVTKLADTAVQHQQRRGQAAMVCRTGEGYRDSAGIGAASRLDFSGSSSSSLLESDLCCMEDSWEKDSPDPPAPVSTCTAAVDVTSVRGTAPHTRVAQRKQMPKGEGARSSSSLGERNAPLRRCRPAAAEGSCRGLGVPREEKIDVLIKMMGAQDKFRPQGVMQGGKASCHSVSPFVAERRRWFVAWKNQMATFLGYSRDTVAVAMNYFDRYTCARPCSPTLAQAVAATALHLAAKFEESSPASLRQLLKFTPVFTPDQLLVMEMSMLTVLKWDLRPATVYDFVRAFCALLPSAPSTGAPVTLSSKEDKEDELEQLRVGAEEIADLSASASSSPCDKFHEDVLDIACVEAVVGGSDSEAKGSVSLQRVLDCIQLLGSKLSERYPAVASAAAAAAARVARYGGLVDKEVMASVEVASAGGAPGIKQSGTITPLPAGVRPKGRRCSTPTGVEGIMHIEMAAIRDASSVGGEEKAGDGRDGAKGAAPVRNGGTGAGKCGNDEVKTDAGMKQARPSAFKQTRHGASAEAVGGGESGNISGGKRSRAGSFAFSDEDIAFARASKKTKGQATVSLQSSTTAVSVAAAADGKTTKTGAPRVVLGGASWQPFKSTTSAGRSPAGTAGATLSIAGDGGKSNRKRSAEVLGHCARGSGFGVPPPRLTQAARVSQHPSPVSEMSAPSMTATVPTTNTSIFTAPG